MVDMTATIAPKSDQMNADDLIGGPRTITITRVTGNEGNAEQPVNVFYQGDDNKPFRPCKSMRRVMVKVWGADASQYVGKSMTLYRDPKVKWGGMEVGGIRISHMSGLTKPEVMALTETRSARKPYTVQPLKDAPAQKPTAEDPRAAAEGWADRFMKAAKACTTLDALDALKAKHAARLDDLGGKHPDLRAECDRVIGEVEGFVGSDDLDDLP